jgi:hypothetical protein
LPANADGSGGSHPHQARTNPSDGEENPPD